MLHVKTHRFQLYLGVALIAVAVLLFFVIRKWPFRKATILIALERGTGDRIEIGGFRRTYFPPGCVIENLRVLDPRAAGFPPLLAAGQVTIRDSYASLLRFRKRVDSVEVVGMHLTIPPKGTDRTLKPETPNAQQTFTIGEVRADDGWLDFAAADRSELAARIEIHHLLLQNVGKQSQMIFRTAIRVPKPLGEVHSSGRIGPWITGNIASTPVMGTYTFQNADLGFLKGVSGMLSSAGKFNGTIGQMTCTGSAEVPDFHVTKSKHFVHVSSNFTLITNAANGNTDIRNVTAHFNNTTVIGRGAVAPVSTDADKTVTIDASVEEGRLEDLLLLFTGHPEPSMRGAIRLNAKFVIPPKPPKFLQRIRIVGDFAVRGSQFNNAQTQAPLNRLSASVGAEHSLQMPAIAYADFHGHVVARNGVASLSRVLLTDPGSAVSLDGTFSLIDRTLDLEGVLRTQGRLSDTTSGLKSLMVKMITPLWRHHAVTEVPFSITGTSAHPHVGVKFVRRADKLTSEKNY